MRICHLLIILFLKRFIVKYIWNQSEMFQIGFTLSVLDGVTNPEMSF